MFAAIMIKYVSGILLSALLILGFHLDSDTEKQTLRSAAVATEKNVQLCVLSECCPPIVTIIKQSKVNHHIFDNRASDDKIDDGVLGNLLSYRNFSTPSKFLKYNLVMNRLMIRLKDSLLTENTRPDFSPNTNYIKYSNRYYVYLGHILI